LTLPSAAHAWAATLLAADPSSHTLVIHAGSGSAAKNWTGFGELAQRWSPSGRVLWVVGPADTVADIPATAEIVRDRGLPDIAALLQRAPLYAGNDSGISHLAALAGTRGVALFGASNPVQWCPLGLHLLRSAPVRDECGAQHFCTHRLPVELVHAALMAMHPREA
jgi:ADP-heptose:LPS heptosyltransferase